ncbi:MAG TPA: ribosomal protein L7/L12 [Longimicrobium sp.]|nr:ribosomal protein L7/L12 [Longimicrobium sp.]
MPRKRMLLRLGVATLIAAMLAGPGAMIVPATLRWAAWIACPKGHTPVVRDVGVAFYCVPPARAANERTLAAMGGLWLMYFVGISVPLTLFAARRPPDGSSSSAAPGTIDVPPAVEARARELMTSGHRFPAVKIVRQATGMGLKEARAWVDALPYRQPGIAATSPSAPAGPPLSAVPPEAQAAARELAAAGQTISAIKVVREATGMGLAESRAWVESFPRQDAIVRQRDRVERLAELERMLEAGLITRTEHEIRKREILAEQ